MKSSVKNSNLHIWLSLSLKAGVFVTCVLMVAGLVVIFTSDNVGTDLTVPLNELAGEITNFDAVVLISLGITVLLLTPIILVIVAAANFFLHKDKLYLAICLILMCILAFNIFLSIA
jgi:uncharacterized membrane protein